MGAILILFFDFVLGLLLGATIRAMFRRRTGIQAWLILIGLMATGGALGYWLAFRFRYSVSPTLIFHGFPIPYAFFQLESGSWVDYITPAPMAIALLDMMFFVLLAAVPLTYYMWRQRHRFDAGMCRTCGYNLTGNTAGRCPECGHAVLEAAL